MGGIGNKRAGSQSWSWENFGQEQERGRAEGKKWRPERRQSGRKWLAMSACTRLQHFLFLNKPFLVIKKKGVIG